MSVFGPDLVGRSLILRPTEDPIGGWVYGLDGDEVAEMVWSRSERAVRMVTEAGVCRIRFRGLFVLSGVVVVGEDEVVQAQFRGGLAGGNVAVAPGRPFVYSSHIDGRVGPWRGVDDPEGEAVLRVRGRLDRGAGWFEVTVTPLPFYGVFVGPLLALLGGLQVLHLARPWLGVTSTFARGR